MEATELLLMGRVSRAHGLRGECKIIPESDDPMRLLNLKQVWVGATPEDAAAVVVDSVRFQHTKRGITGLVRLDGACTPQDAGRYARLNVYARQGDLPPLKPGEFFLHDVVGMTVFAEDGATLGSVKDVWEMPSANIYVIGREGKSDALIPAVPEFVRQLDIAQRTMVVAPIPGML